MRTLDDGTLECTLAEAPPPFQNWLENFFEDRCACCTLDEILLRRVPGENAKLLTKCGVVLELSWASEGKGSA